MAFIDPQKLDALFRKFQEGGEYNPKDGEPPEINESDRSLIEAIFSEYEKIIARREKGEEGSGLADSNDFFSKILEQFKNDNEAFKNAKEYLSYDTEEASQVKSQIVRQQMSKIKRNIEKYALAGELASEAAKRAQEMYKELKKQLDEEMKLQRGIQKGAAVAEKTLQSVFGISRSFDGPGGIIGAVKGFGKGMKETLTTTNILMSLLKKMFEQAVAADKARESLFQRAGLSDFTEQFMEINVELSRAFGPGSAMVAADVVADLQAEMKVFKEFKDSGEIVSMAKMSGKLKRFGVSTTALGSSYQGLRKGIGFGAEETDQIMKQLFTMGKETGMTQQETFESFAKVLPTYARFGRRAPQMFGRLAATARITNIKIEELMALTEGLDTSENALKTAAKINSLLGGSFINGVALLSADAAGKVQMIAEAYQKAEAQFGTPDQRVIRAVQGYVGEAGIDAATFQKVVRGQFQNFGEEVAKQEGAATDEEINTDVQKTLKQTERIDAAMARLVEQMNQAVLKFMPGLTKAVGFLANNTKIIGPLLLAAGAAAAMAHAKSQVDTEIRIPYLNMRIDMLKAENAALRTASTAKGGAGCLEVAGKAIASKVGAEVAEESLEQGAKSLAKSAGGEILEEGGKGLLAKYGPKIASALANSKFLNAIAKFPIIEFLFGFGEMTMIMMREDLDLKAKSRGVVEALTGTIGGWLGGLAGGALGNSLNIALPGLGFI